MVAASLPSVHTRQISEHRVARISRGKPSLSKKDDRAETASKEARDEIYTYVAVRDLLLSDAEVTTTIESLRRATIANEFVESCLRPPRSPYEAQSLEQRHAARELERCCAAKMRIATLQQKLSQRYSNPRRAAEFDVM